MPGVTSSLRRRLAWLWPARRGASERQSAARRRHRGSTALGIQQLEPKLALAVTPSLVVDINQTPQSSYPMNMTVMGDHAYFVAADGVHGQELWKTDGTPEGTTLVKDIFAGPGSSEPWGLTVVGDKLFFSARDELHGSELWVSDGTPHGTQLVKDLATGEDPWSPGQPASASPGRLTPVGDTVYFTAYSGEMAPGMHAGQRGLWKTDGTASGTEMVVGGLETDPSVEDVFALGNVIVFSSQDADSSGIAIWRVDGSAVEQITVFPEADMGSFTVAEGRAFFAVNSWDAGSVAWVTDATAAGTLPLQSTGFNSVGGFTAVDAVVYFTTYAVDDTSFTSEQSLWKTDGTPDGTEVVKGGFVSISEPLAAVGGRLVFAADDGENGRELWQSDGTEGGTTLLADLAPGELTLPVASSEPLSGNPYGFTQRGDELYFFANNGELWKTDGTVDGTELVSDEIGEDDGSGAFGAMAVVGGDLVFRAGDEEFGIELWKSDGTAGGTDLLLDIAPGTLDAWPDYGPRPVAAFLDGSIYFVANDGINGESLWMSDGTEDGTRLVRAGLTDSSLWWSPPSEPYAFDGAVYFGAFDPLSGKELWKTDGTPAGTVMVADLASSFTGGSSDDASSHPRGFTAVGDSLYFIADSEFGNASIWKTDGTEEGTEWVAAFGGYGGVNDLEAAGDRLFYVVPGLGNHLQYFDTVTGEFGGVEFTAADPTAYAEPSNLVAHDGLLYFVGDVGGGIGLHAVPGDLPEGGLETLFTGSVAFLGVVGGWVYFAGDAGDGLGMHVYSTDGTFDGTSLADVPWLGLLADSAPLAVVGSRLYFPSRDADHGLELWTAILNGESVPTDISLSATAVTENAPVGTEVGTFTTTDADASTAFTYALVWGDGSNDNSLFTIEGGVLKTAQVFDFESRDSYSIRVRSTDAGSLAVTRTFTITVTNVAETGSSFAEAIGLSLDELGEAFAEGTIDSMGFTIYRIEIPTGWFFSAAVAGDGTEDALDPIARIWDADGNPVAVNDDVGSSGDGSGLDSVARAYAVGTTDTAVFYIGVSGYPNFTYDPSGGAADGPGAMVTSSSGDYRLTVSLVSEGNSPPTGIGLSRTGFVEAAGAFVGALYGIDADAPNGDAFTFELVAGEGDADNDKYEVIQEFSPYLGLYAYLATVEGFSVDADAVHSVRLRVVDAGGESFEQVIELTVANNLPPTEIVFSGDREVANGSEAGAWVGTLMPFDADSGEELTYSLVEGEGDTDNGLYEVVEEFDSHGLRTFTVQTAQPFAFAGATEHSIRLRVTDTVGYTFEDFFTITVTDDSGPGLVLIESEGNASLLRDDVTGDAVARVGDEDFAVTAAGVASAAGDVDADWQMIAAETVGGVNKILWRYNVTGDVHVWTLDATWAWIGSEGGLVDPASTAGQSIESAFQIDLDGNSIIGEPYAVIESVGNASLLRDSVTGEAVVRVGGADFAVVAFGVAASAGDAGSDWQMVAAETIGGVNQILWLYDVTGDVHVWTLDADWNWMSSEGGLVAVASSAGQAIESAFQIDVDGDWIIGTPYTLVESVGNASLLRHNVTGEAVARVGGVDFAVTAFGVASSAGGVGSDWQMVAAEAIGGVNKILWRYTPTGDVHVWTLDATWAWIGSEGGLVNPASSAGQSIESAFQIDLDGNSIIGTPYTVIESVGNASLLRHGVTGEAVARVGGVDFAVTAFGVASSAGDGGSDWQMVAAETIGGVNKILWRYTPTGDVHVWTLDAAWAWIGSEGGLINPASATGQSIESAFQIDLDGNSVIGVLASIESVGNASLLRHIVTGDAVARVGGVDVAVTVFGAAASAGGVGSDWQMIAAETIGGVNKILWRYNPTGAVHVWTLDATWAWAGSEGGLIDPASAAGQSIESAFQIDLDGNSVIGVLAAVESVGNASLLRHIVTGDAVARVGGVDVAVTVFGAAASAGGVGSDWQMIAAETIGGVNKILWRYNPTGAVHVWTLDATWAWTGSEGGLVDPASAAGITILSQFGLS